jgi:hypothetical protein
MNGKCRKCRLSLPRCFAFPWKRKRLDGGIWNEKEILFLKVLFCEVFNIFTAKGRRQGKRREARCNGLSRFFGLKEGTELSVFEQSLVFSQAGEKRIVIRYINIVDWVVSY